MACAPPTNIATFGMDGEHTAVCCLRTICSLLFSVRFGLSLAEFIRHRITMDISTLEVALDRMGFCATLVCARGGSMPHTGILTFTGRFAMIRWGGGLEICFALAVTDSSSTDSFLAVHSASVCLFRLSASFVAACCLLSLPLCAERCCGALFNWALWLFALAL